MNTDHFQPEKILAAGPSAKVYRGVETATGRKVLIKALLPDHETANPLSRQHLQMLAPSLIQMRHPQIAGLITMLPSQDEFAIVSEYMPGMNARGFAAERQSTPGDLRALAMQLMHALLVGEQMRQPHGDPKPSNLIIADHPGGGLFLQVQDWGLSLARHTHPPETLWFRAPELHAGGHPTTQSDLFTAAGSLFCLATNTAPTQGNTAQEVMMGWQAFNAGHVLSHLRPDIDPPLRDWLCWLLNLAPHMRPHSVAQALDMLMMSMHAGYAYMPQQAPMMAPGAQTTPLVAAQPPSASVAGTQTAPLASAQPPGAGGAPKPKPVQPNSVPAKPAPAAAAKAATSGSRTSAIATAADAAPAVAAKKKSSVNPTRIAMAVILNMAALILMGFILWPGAPSTEASASADSDSPAAATSKAGDKKAAAPAPAKP